uniref:Uncharacterized protein n=1 Tax=Romanomermis culicivorax TaxID=13658 RepID=A0A915KU13_ROMCU
METIVGLQNTLVTPTNRRPWIHEWSPLENLSENFMPARMKKGCPVCCITTMGAIVDCRAPTTDLFLILDGTTATEYFFRTTSSLVANSLLITPRNSDRCIDHFNMNGV